MVAPSAAHRRISRTRLALCRALLDLLSGQAWEALNVQEICSKAGVGRSTFYLHFRDKEDLLETCMNDLQNSLEARADGHASGKGRKRGKNKGEPLNGRDAGDNAHAHGTGDGGTSDGGARPLTFLKQLLNHMVEYQAVFRSVLGRHGSHEIEHRFREMIFQLIHRNLQMSDMRRTHPAFVFTTAQSKTSVEVPTATRASAQASAKRCAERFAATCTEANTKTNTKTCTDVGTEGQNAAWQTKALGRYLAGGVVALLIDWLHAPQAMTVSDLEKTLQSLAQKTMDASLQPVALPSLAPALAPANITVVTLPLSATRAVRRPLPYVRQGST